ncbi:MAG: ATP-binding cassette domain-containing protein [Pseudomonadota bacterium]
MPRRPKPSDPTDARTHVAIRDLSFAYDASERPLFANVSVQLPPGFTGVIGANGSGKTTLLQLLLGRLQPDGGRIERPEHTWYCPQRTDEPPQTLRAFLDDWSGEACALRGKLGVETDWLDRWHSLSHGERKRAQIAQALWREPDLLALDEPTNHIDAGARDLLIDALARYRGVGVIVSHDRELLDALVAQCVWIEPPGVIVTPGSYDRSRALRAEATESIARSREKLRKETQRLREEQVRRRQRAAGEHARRSKRGIDRGDHDAKEKIDRARVTDGGAAAPLKRISSALQRKQEEFDATRTAKVHETGVWLETTHSQRDFVLQVDAGACALDGQRRLVWPAVRIAAQDRIALVGANGAGKTTLLNRWLGDLNAPAERIVYLPQEISAHASRDLLAQIRDLPNDKQGMVLSIVSRLNSRPDRLLASDEPSPGEARKLLLALGILRAPHVIVLDEPTNHLDLPSIEALEGALRNCPCALILVSHDARFVSAVGARRWPLAAETATEVRLRPDL